MKMEEMAKSFLKENLDKMKHKIVVMSGKGGVGKSTVSVNLAYYLASLGKKVGLLDVDVHGPSVGKMTGIEEMRLQVNEQGQPVPIQVPSQKNLYVVTIASMLESPDDPIIWRGPAKNGMIRQFLDEICWPELDFLIVDCPPGTGDEPLSVIQTIGDVSGTVIVSTPQQVALLDVRKSLKFANLLNLPIIGIVENMSGFVCPHCGKTVDIFKTDGTLKTAEDFGTEVLGKIPLDPQVVNATDSGKPYVTLYAQTAAGEAMAQIGKKVADKVEQLANKETVVAIPSENGLLNPHFGHTKYFTLYTLKQKTIVAEEEVPVISGSHKDVIAWLKNDKKVEVIVAGGMGDEAATICRSFGMKLFRGVGVGKCSSIIQLYIEKNLTDREGSCSGHGEGGCGGGCSEGGCCH